MNALVGTVPTLWVLSLQHQPCLHKVGGCLVLCLHAHVELCCPAKCITSSCGVGERGGKGEGGGEREREEMDSINTSHTLVTKTHLCFFWPL